MTATAVRCVVLPSAAAAGRPTAASAAAAAAAAAATRIAAVSVHPAVPPFQRQWQQCRGFHAAAATGAASTASASTSSSSSSSSAAQNESAVKLPPQWVVLGLGNPGARDYGRTRHSVGHMMVEHAAATLLRDEAALAELRGTGGSSGVVVAGGRRGGGQALTLLGRGSGAAGAEADEALFAEVAGPPQPGLMSVVSAEMRFALRPQQAHDQTDEAARAQAPQAQAQAQAPQDGGAAEAAAAVAAATGGRGRLAAVDAGRYWWTREGFARSEQDVDYDDELPATNVLGQVPVARVALARSGTFMNHSGRAARALVDVCGLWPPHKRLVVAYDDVSLPLGTIRLKNRGSAGGHNGLGDVLRQLGGGSARGGGGASKSRIVRLRIGIGRPAAGGAAGAAVLPQGELHRFVLGKFDADELDALAREGGVLDRCVEALQRLMHLGLSDAMTEFNRR